MCLLHQVEAHAATRTALAAETADSSVLLKQLLVRAEDARILRNMGAMKKAYRRLYDLNK
jgi:Bardet-Biedl syndrome 2 protein